MNNSETERERALRWLMANRRKNVSIEQVVRVMCAVLPRDLATMRLMRRVAEEEEARQPATPARNWRTPPS